MLTIGNKVKTNDFYDNQMLWNFGKVNPVKSCTIQDIVNDIAEIRMRNGRTRFINTIFLESL